MGEQEQQQETLTSILTEISASLNQITTAHAEFEESYNKLENFPSQEPVFKQNVEKLQWIIQEHEKDQDLIIDNIKNGLKEEVRRGVEYAVFDQLSSVIEEETAHMVKIEVNEQISEFLPVSLQEVAEASKRQLRDIKNSLENSHARMCNSNIEFKYLTDPLKPVLTDKGEKSPLYPPNVQVLLAYDLPKAKALSKDYGLAETEDLQTNLQQFLKHIGTSVNVVIPDEEVLLNVFG